MANITCPTCGKTNPEELEICQYCGTLLKNRGTEPLAPIRPGEAPVPKKTAELERTLPAWLRDIRKGGADQNTADAAKASEGGENKTSGGGMPLQHTNPPAPASPPPPAKKADSPLDLLAGLSKAGEEEEDVPDWLASLKTNLPGGPVPSPEPAAKPGPQADDSAGTADWLSNLQADTQTSQPTSQWGTDDAPAAAGQAAEPSEPAGDTSTPDWLSALQATDNAAVPPATPASSTSSDDIPSAGSLPDWLSSLTQDSVPPPASPAPAPAEPAAAGDLTDWLAGLDNDTTTAAPAEAAPADLPATGDLPGWLSGMSQGNAPAAPAASEPAAEMPASGDMPDWLAGLGKESAPAAQTPAAAEPPAEIPASGDMPDWLSGLGTESAPAAQTPAAAEPPAEAPATGDMPDWLAGLGAATSGPAQPAVPPMENPPAITTETPAAPAAPTDEPAAPSGLPDWLAAVIDSKAPETPSAPAPEQAKAFETGALEELGTLGGTGGLPDWMAGFGASTAGPAATPEPAPSDASEPATAEPAADAFDWLAGMTGEQTAPAETAAGPAAQPPVEAAAEPTAQAPSPAEQAGPPAQPPAPTAEPNQNLDSILAMDMPDWLSGFTPTDSTPPAKAAEEAPSTPAFGADISPANLPSWVQAMRPMESVISGAESGDEDQNVEKEGPLAGLRSVLPGQTGSLGPHKSNVFSIKLMVDQTQKTQAALLENLIASEAESQPVVTPKRIVTIRPLRWIIGAVLLLAVLIPALLPTDLLPGVFPALPDEQISTFQRKIAGLPAASTVLVVFDYQPGYAGEMEQAAGPVMEDLISKNENLAFVSSSPVGELMSLRLIKSAGQRHPNYKSGENYVDLGYLPGGEAGIQVFANNPEITLGTTPVDLWASTALQGLTRDGNGQVPLSSFAAVVVLTDNPDTGRMWIEQTSQALNGTPLLMVISAQAEPMIRPYLEAGQIQGLVTGLAGGVEYQAAAGQRVSYSYWASYGIGIVASELLILVGGGWALVEHLRARRQEQQNVEEDEA